MSGDEIASILYLVLLLLAIGGYFVVTYARNLGRLIQQALLWGMIFVGVIAAAGLWPSISDRAVPRQAYVGDSIEIPRSIDGHYYLSLVVNGAPLRFVVDTGASGMVLTRQDASRVGINPDRLAYLGRANTANGAVPIADVTLDAVTLNGVTDRRVRASVNGGEMDTSLLGMSYLQRFNRIEIAGNRLVLTR